MPRRPGLDLRAVVGEAAALADARGLEHVNLTNVAERLSVRVPSLYNHIESADELQHQLALFALKALERRISREAIGKSGAAGLLAIANAYRAFAKEHPGMYGATQRAPRPSDPDMLAVSAELLDVLRAVLEPFGLDGDRVIHAMRGFRSIIHGFVSLEIAEGFGLKQNVDDSFRFIVLLFLAGLGAAPRDDAPADRRTT